MSCTTCNHHYTYERPTSTCPRQNRRQRHGNQIRSHMDHLTTNIWTSQLIIDTHLWYLFIGLLWKPQNKIPWNQWEASSERGCQHGSASVFFFAVGVPD